MEKADILIKNGSILTLDKDLILIEGGEIAIRDDKILKVGKNLSFSVRKKIDASGMVVMPGLINTHTHAAMTLLRGYSDDLPLQVWLNKHIFPAEKKYVNAEFIKVGVALAALEMIKSGTTSFLDMYYFEDEAARVCNQIGIRAFLGEAILDFPTPNSKTPEEGLAYTEKLVSRWQGNSLVKAVVAPHATYTCSAENLKKCKNLADRLQIPLHIHLSETRNEVEESIQKFGMSPVEYLDNLGCLGPNLIAAHCVCLSDKDIALLKKYKVKTCDCSESNMKLTSGGMPLKKLQAAGVLVGIGTDGAASNNDLDMFEEMDNVAKFHKIIEMDPSVADAKTVVRMSTCDGAKVLLSEEKIGSLEEGKLADIILVDFRQPHLTPLYNAYSHLVYAASGSDVDTVIINGKLIMEHRKVLTVDENEILEKAKAFGERIKYGR